MEKRKQTRAFLDQGLCKATLHGDELPRQVLDVSNLGVDGCCVEIPIGHPMTRVRHRQQINLELIQPWLPSTTLPGEVCWLKEAHTWGKASVRAGIRFLGLAESYAEDLTRVVEDLVQDTPRGNDWILARLSK
jgi:hypothetical protein